MGATQSQGDPLGRHKTQYKAIPTRYSGVNFRSRLEARWAAFLDVLRWDWEYEPDLQAGFVIPDFILPGFKLLTILECKPAVSLIEIAEQRTTLIRKLQGWLEVGVNEEIVTLDRSDEPLERTDQALDDLMRVEMGVNPLGRSRRILIAGPALHPHHTDDAITVDGEHGFTLCTNGVDADHVGLAAALGAPCLHCGRPAKAWMPREMMLEEWRKVGNAVQWRAVSPE
jgi:hypothetical protein